MTRKDPLADVGPCLVKTLSTLQKAVDWADDQPMERQRRVDLFPLAYVLEDAFHRVMQGKAPSEV